MVIVIQTFNMVKMACIQYMLRGLDTEASKQKVGDQQSRVKLSFNLKKLKLDLAVLNQMQQ